jgi:hypothetical protein
MDDNHPFSMKIDQDPDKNRRFVWLIYEGEKLRERSRQSYATIRHAKADGERFLQKLITAWQSAKK